MEDVEGRDRPQAAAHVLLASRRIAVARRQKSAALGRRTGHDHAVVQHDARLHEQKNEQENHRQGHGGLHRRLAARIAGPRTHPPHCLAPP